MFENINNDGIILFYNREIGVRFADLERKLGEIDRSRAIYSHLSQICDPRVSVCMAQGKCMYGQG